MIYTYRKIFFILLLTIFVNNVSARIGNKILIINSYSSDYQWSNDIVDRIGSELKKTRPNVELNVEYLSSERFPNPRLWVERTDLLFSNYNDQLPLAIVIISDEAWMAYRAAQNGKFNNIPIFLCAVKPHSISIDEYIKNYSTLTLENFTSTQEEIQKYNAAAVVREMNISGYFGLMNNVVPNIDRYAIITDSRFYGIYTKLLIEDYVRKFQPDTEIEYFDARFMNTDSLFKSLRNITPSTGVLLTSWLTGEDGYEYSKNYVYKNMGVKLKAPIFITNNIGIKTGVFLGGYFSSSEFWEQRMSNMVNRLLDRIVLNDIFYETYIDTQCQVNWEVLTQFRLSETKFPKSTFYISKPEPIFVKYYTQLIWLILFLLMVVFGYVYTLKSNLRLKRAQKLASKAIVDAYEANKHLIEVQRNLEIALDKAKTADKLKSAFISNMDHEIRTPLNSIVGFSSLITTMDDKKDIEEASILIADSSEKLLQIIKGVLDLSQLESDTTNFNYENVDIDGICQDLINIATNKVKSNLTIVFRPPAKSCSIIAESCRVSQVLSNLMDNAIKFTNEGVIELGYFLCKNDKWIEFYVSDTGIGIKQDEIEKVFDRFYKCDTYILGAGLGLSISKRIIEIMRGEIGVTSELGVGSRFWVRIKYIPGNNRDIII